MSFSFPGVDTRIGTNLDGKAGVRSRIAYITGCNYVDSQPKREPMGGNDHRVRTTLGGSNGMLELSNVVSNMKRRTSSIHRVLRDRREPGFY